MDQKSLAVIIAVSIILTGGNLWLHRGDTPLGQATMHEFGISFNFPENLPMSVNTPPGWDQGYWEGAVQGEDISGTRRSRDYSGQQDQRIPRKKA